MGSAADPLTSPRTASVRATTSSLGNVIALVLVASSPVVLSGAMSTEMRADIGFGDRDLGLAVTSYYVAAASLSVAGGRLTERFGPSWSARRAALLAAISCSAIGVADRLAVVFPALALGGASIALTQPAATAVIVGHVPFHRRGLAFGIKQSAIPSGTALAGIAVPTVALTVGWRWAFLCAGLAAAVTAFVVPKRVGGACAVPAARPAELSDSHGKLVALAAASALGAAPALSLPVFLTSSAISRDISAGQAGALLAIGSAVGLVARLIAGARADRRPGNHLRPIGLLMALGAVGLFGMTSHQPVMFTGAMMLAFAAGRAWQGLFNHAVTSHWPATPAAVTGITQTGSYAGGIIGPMAFGLLTNRWSDRAGWAALGMMMATATVLILWVKRRMGAPSG